MSASQTRFGAGATNVLLQQVRRNRQVMAAVGRARPEPTTGERPDAVATHQACDTTPAGRPALRPQRGVHPGAAVAAMMLGMKATDVGEQLAVRR